MADLQLNDKKGRPASQRGSPHRLSIRIDLTPMVDLGFLLITFFMLTTMLSKPQVMPVVMPDNTPPEDPPEVGQSQVLTLLLGANDKVYWYSGISDARLDSTTYEASGLRRILLDKKRGVLQQFGETERLVAGMKDTSKKVSKLNVLIKATPESRYANVVDVFDEMKICGIDHYVLMDISPQELAFIQYPSAGLDFSVADQFKAAYRK